MSDENTEELEGSFLKKDNDIDIMTLTNTFLRNMPKAFLRPSSITAIAVGLGLFYYIRKRSYQGIVSPVVPQVKDAIILSGVRLLGYADLLVPSPIKSRIKEGLVILVLLTLMLIKAFGLHVVYYIAYLCYQVGRGLVSIPLLAYPFLFFIYYLDRVSPDSLDLSPPAILSRALIYTDPRVLESRRFLKGVCNEKINLMIQSLKHELEKRAAEEVRKEASDAIVRSTSTYSEVMCNLVEDISALTSLDLVYIGGSTIASSVAKPAKGGVITIEDSLRVFSRSSPISLTVSPDSPLTLVLRNHSTTGLGRTLDEIKDTEFLTYKLQVDTRPREVSTTGNGEEEQRVVRDKGRKLTRT